jgi:recombination protein RecA
MRLDIRKMAAIKQADEVIGVHARVKVVKNKLAPPFKQAEFDIIYGQGISREGDLLDLATAQGLITKSGAWYSHGTDRIAQGRENAKTYLKEHPELAADLEQQVRAAHGMLPPGAPTPTTETQE